MLKVKYSLIHKHQLSKKSPPGRLYESIGRAFGTYGAGGKLVVRWLFSARAFSLAFFMRGPT